MIDFVGSGILNLRKVHTFVLDEADEMLGMQNMADQSIRIRKYAKIFFSFLILVQSSTEDVPIPAIQCYFYRRSNGVC